MATFAYTAVNKEGKTESSTIEAVDMLAAGHLLKEQGLMPLDLQEKHDQAFMQFLNNFATISLKQKIVFIEDLHIMLKSGITAPRALKIIAKQTKNKRFQNILFDLSSQVEAGKSLHEAMEAYPKVFSHIFVSMVKVGELSGNLEKSLEYLSIQLEREADLKSKTKGAMIYPAVIVSAMVIIGIMMAIFVLPKLTATFKEFGGQLPFMTQLVVSASDFMAANSVVVIVGLIVIVAGFVLGLRTPPGRQGFDWFLLHIPIIAPIVKKINMARFARIMSSLMGSGIAIIEGLAVTAQAMDNVYYKQVIQDAAENVKLGKPLTESLSANDKLFPFIITQMLEVGEETGSLENIMEQLAVHFEAEVDNTMKNFSSVIEPLLLLVIGGVVGFLALALISPIYNISQSIQ
jgi:type IV pilus assembly protein PilC